MSPNRSGSAPGRRWRRWRSSRRRTGSAGWGREPDAAGRAASTGARGREGVRVTAMTSIGLVIAAPARFPAADTLQDAVPLCDTLRRRGTACRAVDWADAEVDWSDFDLVVLRSPWDYSQRPRDFDDWLERAGAQTRILNEPDLVRWNADKRYLRELEDAGIAVVPTSYHDDEQLLARALDTAAESAAEGSERRPDAGAEPHVVLKPTAGAGAQLAGLLRPDDPASDLRWHADKRYLRELEDAGIAVVPTSYHDDEQLLARALDTAAESAAEGSERRPDAGAEPHVVLKPTAGAGAQLAGLLRPDDPAALALGRSILAEGRTVMLQPEIPELTAGREKALYMVDGRFTHAVAKGALLARGGGLRGGSYRETPAQVHASDAERSFA